MRSGFNPFGDHFAFEGGGQAGQHHEDDQHRHGAQALLRRLKVWERLVTDLDLSKLHALTTHVRLDDVPQVAADIVAGKVKGRVVVDIR